MSGRSLVLRPNSRTADAADQAINDFQSEMAEIIGAPYPRQVQLTVHILAGMVLALVVLANIMTLDIVVSSRGRIISRTPTITVQPLESSVIREVLVRPGQTVKKGDVLVILDPTLTGADVSQLQSRVETLRAQVARLEAEQAGAPFKAADQASISWSTQLEIWRSRQAERESRLAVYDQKIKSIQGTIQSSSRDAEYYRSRLAVNSEIEKMRSELARKEVGSRLNVLVAQDNKAEIARNLSNSEQQIVTARHELQSLGAEREAYMQEWNSSVSQELVSRRTELQQVADELSKAEYRRNLIELRAVSDATVVKVADIGNGAVVPSGEVIVSLVPSNAELEVEADIAGTDQGFVKPGDETKIKLDAYRFTEYGTVVGRVRSVSADSFNRLDDGTPSGTRFYKSRIEITEIKLRNVPKDVTLLPGMPLQADIVVGERTIMQYLLGTVIKNISEGMREPS
ncbi:MULTISPECIES: HlyD family type I secretion periplasmic adaptor subunit [unclassified Azospirillum]|jgi:HlyD family type I secretion membrane fusion protein|uniref:HlyD family type I secretion periplasmic adaptor subunit n=1 Tax=unclassified Azospirillum TaxID=2630922 RepID=UPI000B7304C7|nr:MULTISPECIES: HlyD family type I secretion periplasmic adaptor subunit [unclassified Azospirillum]SNT17349.1 type I secretion membrane fusion protein, HlyD family [Azospirillum sp. RU38E]SNT29578.1 type I secretion membrane fusion protein, HlyD family [Azospirillum sp. RU37A]